VGDKPENRGGASSTDDGARELLRGAYEAVYRYPPGFGGFSAGVHYAWDQESWGGSVRVESPANIRFEGGISGCDEHFRWELASMVGHHWWLPFDEAEGGMELSLESRENPLGRIVKVEDGLDSKYRVRGGQVIQIERRFRDLRFSINIQQRDFTEDGRTLPIHFCVVYWSVAGGRLVRTDVYRDGYKKVEGVHLPLSRRIITSDDSGSTTRQILFRGHELLAGSESRKKV
jgi:hypothetical protein